MSGDDSPQDTLRDELRGAYWCLRLNTDAGMLEAAIHAPFFYLVSYRHRHEFEQRMEAMDHAE